MNKKVSDYIFEFLRDRAGVDTVFMLPGGGCMHLVDSLGKTTGVKYICNLHEQASAIGAESYAQDKNALGVCLVTAGPGSTNAITGVAGAWIDSTPMLVLSGQAKVEDMMTGKQIRQMGIQEVDTESLLKPVTKYAKCVKDASMIRYELEKAYYLAMNGRRGPVWLDIPLDVQGATVDIDALEGYVPAPEAEPDHEAMAQEILSFLKQAKRPCIYAGNGIRAAGAVRDFIKLAEMLQIPVMTSWKAADFLPEDHPLFVGRPGIIAQRGANFIQQTCDCILILGTRLDLCQTGFNAPGFAPKAKRLMVDIDIHEIEKFGVEFDGKYAADAGKIIRAMLALAPQPLDCKDFLAKGKLWQKKYPVIPVEYCDETKTLVNLYHLTKVFGELLGEGDTFVPGSSGACAEVTMQAIPVQQGVRIHNTPGLGSMGFGLPAAIGAAAAAPEKRVVTVIGDGGLQHNIQELETLRRLNYNIKLFVLNNNGYGSIVNMQRGRFDGHFVASTPESGLTLPDLEKIANAYGLPYVKISVPAALKEQVQKIFAMSGSVVCEVMIDPAIPSAPRLASRALPDGRMVSEPMENLAPFLPSEELSEILNAE